MKLIPTFRRLVLFFCASGVFLYGAGPFGCSGSGSDTPTQEVTPGSGPGTAGTSGQGVSSGSGGTPAGGSGGTAGAGGVGGGGMISTGGTSGSGGATACRPLDQRRGIAAAVPVISTALKNRLASIYAAGQLQTSPRRRNTFSKIGDSISISRSFLGDLGCPGEYDLGPYDGTGGRVNLSPVIDFFDDVAFPGDILCGTNPLNSFSRYSLAAQEGKTADWPLQTFQASGTPPPSSCAATTTPLACEFNAANPVVALVMYGTNELQAYAEQPNRGVETYRNNLTSLLLAIAAQNVIPVVSTLPPRLDGYGGTHVAAFNEAVCSVAASLQLPLWDYWAALQGIDHPINLVLDDGRTPDLIHPAAYQGGNAGHFTDAALQYGYNVRNLTALLVLEKIKRIVIDNGTPDP